MEEDTVIDFAPVVEASIVEGPALEGRSKRKSRNPRRTSDSLRRIQRDQRRLSRAMMTPEQREAARQKARDHQRKKRADLTLEQRELERQMGRERMRRKRAAMTPEQKETKRQHERERMRLKRASLDPEKKEAVRKKDRERMRIKRATLDPVEKEEKRKKDRERMRRVRATNANKDAEQITQETGENDNEMSVLDTSYGLPSEQTEKIGMDMTGEQPSIVHPAEVKWEWKYYNQESESMTLCQS